MEKNNSKVDVSFVIPVYNVEHYVKQCVESIFSQTIDSFEILFIDDGSTDRGPDICREYAARYSNIKFFSQAHKGVSCARNLGIINSSGEYICFLDSDDFYICDFAKSFYQMCKTNHLDVIRGTYNIYNEEEDSFIQREHRTIDDFCNKPLSGKEFLIKSIKYGKNEVVPWLGFFRKKFLIDNQVFFPEGIGYEEDHLFFLKALLCDDCKIMHVETCFYAYRNRQSSVTKKPVVQQAIDVSRIVIKENECLKKTPLSSDEMAYVKRYISASVYQMTSIYGRVPKCDQTIIRTLLPKKVLIQSIAFSSNKHQKIKIFLFCFFPRLVSFIYKLKDDR